MMGNNKDVKWEHGSPPIFTRTIRSIKWNSYSSVVNIITGAIQLVILTRLLEPRVFGIYTSALATIKVLSILANFGMGAAFLHRSEESEDILKAAAVHFTIKTILTFLWGILVVIGVFFFTTRGQEEIRISFIAITGSEIILHLCQTPRLILVRLVEHKKLAFVDIADSLLSVVTVVTFAFIFKDVRALLIGNITSAFVNLIGFYFIKPFWKPKLYWSPKIFGYFIRFGFSQLLNIGLVKALDNVDDIWTGYYLGSTSLGFYSRAYKFAKYPSQIIASPIDAVALGTFAELKNNGNLLSIAFNQTSSTIIRSGFFFAGLFSSIASEFIIIVMGEKWLPALPVFRLMLIFALFDPLKETMSSLFIALGKMKQVVVVKLLQFFLLITGLYLLGFKV